MAQHVERAEAAAAAESRDGPTVEQEHVFMQRMGRERKLCQCCGGVDTLRLLSSMASRERVPPPPPPPMPPLPAGCARPAASDDSNGTGDTDGYVTAADSAESWRSAGDSGSNDTVLSAAAAPSELALDKYLRDEMALCRQSDKEHKAAGSPPVGASARRSTSGGLLPARTTSSVATAASGRSSTSSCGTVVYVSSTDRDALRRQAHMTGMRLRARVDGDGLPNVLAALPPHTASVHSAEQLRSEWWPWPEPPHAPASAAVVPARGVDSVRTVVEATSSGKSIGMARRSPLQKLLATDFYRQLIAASDAAGAETAEPAKPAESRCSSAGGGDVDSDASDTAQVTAVLRTHMPPPPPVKPLAVVSVPPLGTGRVRALVRYFEREITRLGGALARRRNRRNKDALPPPPRAAIAGR